MEVDRNLIDYYVFQSLARNARKDFKRGNVTNAGAKIERALELWRGEPLADVRTERAANWREHVTRKEWFPACALRIDVALTLGNWDRAHELLDELPEPFAGRLGMLNRRLFTLHKSGRAAEVEDNFHHWYRKLRHEELPEAAASLREFHEDLVRDAKDAKDANRKFPPERAPIRLDRRPVTPRMLPHDNPSFAGRGDLLAWLDELTGIATGEARPRVIVLAGQGGVGKSSLAVRWGHLAERCFPGGTLYADLRGYSDTPRMDKNELVDVFLAALAGDDAHPGGPTGRAEKLRMGLADGAAGATLVVLDNAVNTAHIDAILPLLARCVVLVTSRDRLSAIAQRYGTPPIVVPPFHDDAARQLLASKIGDRAAAEPDALAELARICDGLPLALNMVADSAARSPGAPLHQVAHRLRDHETLLRTGDGGSLHTALTYSYELLEPGDARLFRLLGVHPNPEFSAELAASLAGEPLAATEQRLERLVDAHLLAQPGELHRYRLHDLLFAYTRIRPRAHDEVTEAQSRMLSFYLTSSYHAHRAAFPHRGAPDPLPAVPQSLPVQFHDDRQATTWCIRERNNLLSAVAFAARLGRHDFAWRIPHFIGVIFKRYGFYDDIASSLHIAAESAEASGNHDAQASSLNDLADLALIRNDPETAASHLRTALRIFEEAGQRIGELTIRLNFGRYRHQIGDLDEAVRIYRECAVLADESGDHHRRAVSRHRLGQVLVDQRHYLEAAECFQLALEIRAHAGDRPGRLECLIELAALAGHRGDRQQADRYADQAVELLDPDYDITAGVRTYTVLAQLELDKDRLDKAYTFASLAFTHAEQAGDDLGSATALELSGSIAQRRRDHDTARNLWTRAAQLCRVANRPDRANSIEGRLRDLPGHEAHVPRARAEDESLRSAIPHPSAP